MSWMTALYETYERCAANERLMQSAPSLMPVSHTAQQAHIEVTVSGEGEFMRARAVDREETLIPATEQSAGRTSGCAPHPLADKIQYCAGDYSSFGGQKVSYFKEYLSGVQNWAASPYSHPKVRAVYQYLKKERLVADLIAAGILKLDSANRLLRAWPAENEEAPHIFKVLTKKKEGGVSIQDQGDAFVRWIVEEPGSPCRECCKDPSLLEAWRLFAQSSMQKHGFCLVSGATRQLAEQHPAKIRNLADKAKLISSNDTNGFTYRGRFTDKDCEQACAIGFDVSQKAHAALRWLIQRQKTGVTGEQVYVAWSLRGADVPHPLLNSLELFGVSEESAVLPTADMAGDVGQHFAVRLQRAIAGYSADLETSEPIVVMGIDSATPGRMAIIYYRELLSSDFLERIQCWHESFSWPQRIVQHGGSSDSPKTRLVTWQPYAPSPRQIAEAAYGARLDESLKKATVERLLPCIVDGRAFPRDLVELTVGRAAQRSSFKQSEQWEWEKYIGVACAVFRGAAARCSWGNEKEGYKMTLETTRKTRDYLFGRLLACAENLESYALALAGEERETNAARYMHRFADRPSTTWLILEKQLAPYRSRLQAMRPGVLAKLKDEIDEIVAAFEPEQFTNDRRLSGEFLLGYHCQRHAFLLARRQRSSEMPNLVTATKE